VLTAANGREAVALLETSVIDLAILDFNMGDMDGASVLQIYRFGKLAPAPACILTADSAAATTRRLMEGGAAAVLHKPIDLATLRQAISQLLSAGPAPDQKAHDASICIDASAIAELRELGRDDIFFEQVLNTAAADIETLCKALAAALRKHDLAATRNKAHALKGVSVSVGAVQLCSIATRLTQLVQADLVREDAALLAEIGAVSAQTVSALRGMLKSPAA
jgi:two-component system sensor histidine kinase RpfC